MAGEVNNQLEAGATLTAQVPDFAPYVMSRDNSPIETPEIDTKSGTTNQDGDSVSVPPITTPGWNNQDVSAAGKGEAQATDGVEGQDNRPEMHPNRKALIETAESMLGTKPWQSSPYAALTQNGLMSGGAIFSDIVQRSGFPNVSSPHVLGPGGLQEQLLKSGFMERPLEYARPGDIYVSPTPGGHARIGMIGRDGSIYTHGREGDFKRISSTSPRHGYVLSPPETCDE